MTTTVAATTQDPTAVAGPRVLSFIIDCVVMISLIPTGLFFLFANFTMFSDAPSCEALESAGIIDSSWVCSASTTGGDTVVYKWIAFVPAFGAALLYGIAVMLILQGLTGNTLGKAITRIRTVDATGAPPGVGTQMLRSIGGIADMFPWGCCWLIPLVGLITMLVTKRHQRVGDLISKTYVVRASDRGRPVALAQGPTPDPYPVQPVPDAWQSMPPPVPSQGPPEAFTIVGEPPPLSMPPPYIQEPQQAAPPPPPLGPPTAPPTAPPPPPQ